ncbi:MAG: ABC transporter substrate-binding protein [Oscillospiraceae bacterium]|nr:ABC transporter substrate-binding protein [Oscillospiraceae bacterium]
MAKKIIALLLAVCLIASFCACGADKGGDTIYIGVYEPQSGSNGAGGKQEILGMQYANSLVNTVEVGGKTYKVELVYADNESSTDKAITAATKLVSSKCSVVLGSYGSAVAIAAGETFANAKLPAIGVTCTNPAVTDGNDYYFRICFLDPFQGTVLANFANDEIGAKTVYCLGELGNDYDQGLINYFKEAGEALGMTIITESFPSDNSDFTSYLTNAKNAGADAIFAPCSISYAQLIIEQCSTQGISLPIVAPDTWDSNVILNAAKGTDLDINVTTFFAEGGAPEFEEGLKAWINGDATNLTNNGGDDTISAVTVMGYDAYNVALEAIKAAGTTDTAKIRDAIAGLSTSGITGSISFNAIGDANRDAAYIKHANTETGAWDFVAIQGVN